MITYIKFFSLLALASLASVDAHADGQPWEDGFSCTKIENSTYVGSYSITVGTSHKKGAWGAVAYMKVASGYSAHGARKYACENTSSTTFVCTVDDVSVTVDTSTAPDSQGYFQAVMNYPYGFLGSYDHDVTCWAVEGADEIIQQEWGKFEL